MASMSEIRRRISMNTPHIVTASGNIATFETDMKAPLKSCKVHFSPVQEGEGDPSPDNVRPITGWNGAKVFRAGKNLTSDNHVLVGAQIRNVDGNYEITAANIYSILSIDVPKNTALHIHKEIASGSELGLGTEIAEYGLPVMRIGSMTNYYNRDFSTGDYPYAYLMIGKNVAIDDPDIKWQIEVGNAATAYEVPRGTMEIAVDWTNEAGTIYGGYVDLVTGEVWRTWSAKKIGTNLQQWSNWGSKGLMYNINIMADRIAGTSVYADAMQIDGIGNPQLKDVGVLAYYKTNASYPKYLFLQTGISGEGSEYTSERRKYVQGNFGDVTVVYNHEPVLVGSITPKKLKTFIGTNNIWSTANGEIDASYWTH